MKNKQLRGITIGVCEIITGLTAVATLGNYRYDAAWKFLIWEARRQCKQP